MSRDRVLLAEIVDAAERVIDICGGTAGRGSRGRPRSSGRTPLELHSPGRGDCSALRDNPIRSQRGSLERSCSAEEPNRARHWSVDLDILLTTARDDLPALLAAVQAVAASMTETENDT